MKYFLSLILIVALSSAFGQINKKIIGKWVICEKTEQLGKFNELSFVKDDAIATNACVEKNCKYSQWVFEKNGDEMKLTVNMTSGCKDAASTGFATWPGTWSVDKKNILTVFDDHYTKHLFEVTMGSNTELQLKRVK